MPAAKPLAGEMGSHDVLDLGQLLGETWEGFRLVGQTGGQGVFVHSAWRRPFTAGEIYSLFWRCQQVEALQFKIRQLEKDLAAEAERAERADDRARFYRSQLALESRMGMMLSGLQAA